MHNIKLEKCRERNGNIKNAPEENDSKLKLASWEIKIPNRARHARAIGDLLLIED